MVPKPDIDLMILIIKSNLYSFNSFDSFKSTCLATLATFNPKFSDKNKVANWNEYQLFRERCVNEIGCQRMWYFHAPTINAGNFAWKQSGFWQFDILEFEATLSSLN